MRSQIIQTFEEKLFQAIKLENTEAIKATLPFYIKEKNSLANNRLAQHPTPFHYAIESTKSPTNILKIIKIIFFSCPKELKQEWLDETNDKDETPLDIILSDRLRSTDKTLQDKFMQNWIEVYNELKLHGATASMHKNRTRQWENFSITFKTPETKPVQITSRRRAAKTVFEGDKNVVEFRAKYATTRVDLTEKVRNALDEGSNAESECSETSATTIIHHQTATPSASSIGEHGSVIIAKTYPVINQRREKPELETSFSSNADSSSTDDNKIYRFTLPPRTPEEHSMSTASTIKMSQDLAEQDSKNEPAQVNFTHASNVRHKREKCAPGCVIM
ncbi:MAG: hypothetical protein K0R98_598 [Rickettsiaceae bacterium]|jgi:hypothetical protein|nr:hypothetical protein [Rickettsiaceae bacterium]